MICCSYRGYWTSRGRPSEKGFALDAAASLKWIATHHSTVSPSPQIPLIVWGQSIGAGVATTLSSQQDLFSHGLTLQTLILETPFLSIRSMLETLYPQKWLPYRHLWPFLWNHLDSWKALGVLKDKAEGLGVQVPEILILEAGKDELVPRKHGEMLEKRCRDLGMQVSRKVIGGALHTEVLVRPEGRAAVVNSIRKACQDILMK
ncbi:hypothetical protein B7494_g5293 [Chlorociboria aeruginascens]|nr:hypothetical protein B7494_g5293 [Chlorociboria aeruginascens]